MVINRNAEIATHVDILMIFTEPTTKYSNVFLYTVRDNVLFITQVFIKIYGYTS